MCVYQGFHSVIRRSLIPRTPPFHRTNCTSQLSPAPTLSNLLPWWGAGTTYYVLLPKVENVVLRSDYSVSEIDIGSSQLINYSLRIRTQDIKHIEVLYSFKQAYIQSFMRSFIHAFYSCIHSVDQPETETESIHFRHLDTLGFSVLSHSSSHNNRRINSEESIHSHAWLLLPIEQVKQHSLLDWMLPAANRLIMMRWFSHTLHESKLTLPRMPIQPIRHFTIFRGYSFIHSLSDTLQNQHNHNSQFTLRRFSTWILFWDGYYSQTSSVPITSSRSKTFVLRHFCLRPKPPRFQQNIRTLRL